MRENLECNIEGNFKKIRVLTGLFPERVFEQGSFLLMHCHRLLPEWQKS